MMANCGFQAPERKLAQLQTLLALVVGSLDSAISPENAFRVRKLVPRSGAADLRGLGQLAHEEKPEEVARTVSREAANAILFKDLAGS